MGHLNYIYISIRFPCRGLRGGGPRAAGHPKAPAPRRPGFPSGFVTGLFFLTDTCEMDKMGTRAAAVGTQGLGLRLGSGLLGWDMKARFQGAYVCMYRIDRNRFNGVYLAFEPTALLRSLDDVFSILWRDLRTGQGWVYVYDSVARGRPKGVNTRNYTRSRERSQKTRNECLKRDGNGCAFSLKPCPFLRARPIESAHIGAPKQKKQHWDFSPGHPRQY